MKKMKNRQSPSERASSNNQSGRKPGLGIGIKIILPYLFLTLVTATIGAYVISNLVTSSFQDRFKNQLVDAGRLVAEGTVQYENNRLRTLRTVAGTIGVSDALANDNSVRLSELVPQIIANSNSHVVKLLDMNGQEVYGWQRLPNLEVTVPRETSGEDFSQNAEIQRILQGRVDEFGDKRVLIHDVYNQSVLFTVGPIFQDGEQVGIVMIGDEIHQMVVDLTIGVVARVTLYDKTGQVIDTTLGGGQETTDPAQTLATLRETPTRYLEVVSKAANESPTREVNLLEQQYTLAFSDWRLRGQSFGMFSVALSNDFIFTTLTDSRDVFSLLFAIATLGVLAVGFFTARQIIKPVERLVETALAVSSGDWEQRSGIESRDEIGKLAETFDLMTQTLAHQNRELTEQASKLEAILNSIADGVIVLDMNDQFITTNVAAQKLLADMSHDFLAGPLRQLAAPGTHTDKETTNDSSYTLMLESNRYQIGNRFMSSLAAPVKTPEGEQVGTVIVVRDITSEAEADYLKDAFITSISHELRTPLTVIKVYTDLMLKTANGHLDGRYLNFLQKISKNSQHLEQHINQLINISEIQAGTFKLERKRVDFVPLIRAVTDKWQDRMESKGLSFTVQLPEEALWISADANQLSWAIEVLLSNALNYTQAGSVKIRVSVVGREVHLSVNDTGIGIATADQPRLFDRFFRASNAVNYNVRGVGLGLFITRSIVELHNGRIWLESESGMGSTFSFALPLMEQE